jgi:sugar phosphate isomerase/epimerase
MAQPAWRFSKAFSPDMYTRRQWGKLALAAIPLSSAAATNGVDIGVATFSYNSLPLAGQLDAIIASMKDCGVKSCLLNPPSTEPVELASKARPPRGAGRGRAPLTPEQTAAIEELRQWHINVPLDYYVTLRKKFTGAGLEIDTYEPSLGAATSDEDINRAFEVTKTLGARCLADNFTKSVAKRVAPFADKHNIKVALQGRPFIATDPDAMSKPADFEEVMTYSKNFGSSIDIGDATGGGWDTLKFIQDTHSRIFSLNIKDRTKAGMSVPWGQGDSHVKETFQLIRDKNYPIRCFIDCDYATAEGTTRIADVKRCAEFARAALS